jgi:hypothetical protein
MSAALYPIGVGPVAAGVATGACTGADAATPIIGCVLAARLALPKSPARFCPGPAIDADAAVPALIAAPPIV